MPLDAFARLQRVRSGQLMWFLGAGSSVSAGVPTAGQLIWRFKRLLYATETSTPIASIDVADPASQQRLEQYFEKQGRQPPSGAPNEYATFFEAAYPFPADRRRFLDELIVTARPAYGQLGLAALMRAGVLPVVWTTNFDRAVEDAMIDVSGTTTALTTAYLADPAVAARGLAESRFPLLVKLHGDYQSDNLKNTPAELQEQDAELRRTLQAACLRFGLVVAGYSGRDASVMEALASAAAQPNAFPGGLFWIHRDPDPPTGPAAELLARLDEGGLQVAWVRALSFDDLIKQVLVPIELPSEMSAKLAAARTAPPAAAPAAISSPRLPEPSLRYARSSDGVTIAYTSTGHGPTLVVLPSAPFSNVIGQWRIPRFRAAYQRLARHLRLVMYDARGTGDSQRDVDQVDLETMLRDLEAVVEQSGIGEFALFGNYFSTPTAIAYAARSESRVTRLILLGGASWQEYAGGMGLRQFQALAPLIDRDWDLFVNSLVRVWVGWSAGEEGQLLAEALQKAVTPDVVRRTLDAMGRVDVSEDLHSIRVPALVLHRDGYPEIPLEVSQRLAEALPDGRLLRLSGASAGFLFEEGDVDVLLDFLTAEPGGPLLRSAQ